MIEVDFVKYTVYSESRKKYPRKKCHGKISSEKTSDGKNIQGKNTQWENISGGKNDLKGLK